MGEGAEIKCPIGLHSLTKTKMVTSIDPVIVLNQFQCGSTDKACQQQERMYYDQELAAAAAYASGRRCVCTHQMAALFCVK